MIHNFSVGYVEQVNDFIIRVTFTSESPITEKDLREITAIRKSIFQENCYCTIVDAKKDFIRFSKGAQTFLANNPEIYKVRIAEAILVKNFGQKLGAEMYIRIFKPQRNTKVFYKEGRALNWLKERYDEYNSNL